MDKFIISLKNEIKKRGLKQKAIAAKMGWNERQFSDMMHNRRNITPRDIEKLCDALGVTPNDLFGIKDKNKTA